jgi:hypothetical protein
MTRAPGSEGASTGQSLEGGSTPEGLFIGEVVEAGFDGGVLGWQRQHSEMAVKSGGRQ